MQDVHVTTLWCALLAKLLKGVNRCVPSPVTSLQYRVLLQLDLPETRGAGTNRLAFALVSRPLDIEVALESLVALGYIERDGASGACWVTPAGREFARGASREVALFMGRGLAGLDEAERRVLDEAVWENLSIPGSFFVQHATSAVKGRSLPLVYELTSYATIKQAVDLAVKRDAELSFTSFRFLLELYPKRSGDKLLRSKDVARLLRVGRSYVSTEAVKLEQRNLVRRVPDPDDARGISYGLTPAGSGLVRSTVDDLMAIYAGVFTMHGIEPGVMRQLTRSLVAGFDAALEQL